jgi:NADH-quinone oxidoreductase subunit L
MVSMQIVLLAIILLHYEEHASHFVEEGFLTTSLTVGILVTASYLIVLFKPAVPAFSRIGVFLTDRMYLPFLNDYILPQIGWVVIRVVDACNRGVDFFFHTAIPSAFEALSRAIRSIQKGYLRVYMKIVAGSIMLFLVIFSLMGW